jgi:hypothetical protein
MIGEEEVPTLATTEIDLQVQKDNVATKTALPPLQALRVQVRQAPHVLPVNQKAIVKSESASKFSALLPQSRYKIHLTPIKAIAGQ